MYASASGYRTPTRSRQRSRTHSDPGHPYVSPPYTIRWPVPARQQTESMGMTAGTPYQQSPPRNSSVERIGDPFVPHPGSLLAQHQMPHSPGGTSSSTPVSPRSPSPQRSGHQRSSSRQGSIRAPQGPGPLIRDVPQPSRMALNVFSSVTSGWGRGQGQSPIPPAPTPFQSAGMHRQGWSHDVYQQSSVYQNTSAPHLSSHHSGHHHPSTTHHIVHPRSRSRPPSAASHRYASSITQPVYGHGSSATLNASRISLNGVNGASQRNHHPTSPPPGMSVSYHPGTGPTHMPSGSPQRSRSHTRVPPSSPHGTIVAAQPIHKVTETRPSPPAPARAANEIRRTTQRPALPANYDGQVQTRYVNMLLALDDISPLFNILAAFFTWILLAGFLLFPGTFASWETEPAGTPQSVILDVVNNVSLYIIAWICTGIGACGMIWLWWRWQKNYVWITNRIFIPGCLNSVAGVISTLSSVFGTQGGVFGKTEKSTIIVTGALSLICGILVLVYEFWLIRNLKLEHDREVGVEVAGKHGEGVLGDKDDQNRGA